MNIQEKIKNKYIMDFNKMREKHFITNDTKLNINNKIIQPYFHDIENHLLNYIENSSYIIGCVAWLTNKNILDAITNLNGAKIIINKEEYLNSNMEKGKKYFYKCLRGRYNDISDMFDKICKCCNKIMIECDKFKNIFGPIKNKSGAILTCGIVNNFSKMHHKFLILFNENVEPTGIWTGSYNLSSNSNFSLENALYITDNDVIIEYIKEFMTIYYFSEPYNWKSGLLSSPI
jgi:hypothetical protein